MNIEVLFFGQLRELTSVPQKVVVLKDGARLTDLVEHLGIEYGAPFRQQIKDILGLRILINGREYALVGGMEASLNKGDTVVFLPPIAGG
jgi:molybdopterin converting factor small subunit